MKADRLPDRGQTTAEGGLLRPVVLAVLVVLSSSGCTTTAGLFPDRSGTLPFASKTDEESFRKQIQTDCFPTAAQAGLGRCGSGQ